MTSESTYRDKGRAAVLAALMVLSVVAMSASFAGAVAADHNDDITRDHDTALQAPDDDGGNVYAGQTVVVEGASGTANIVQGDTHVKGIRTYSEGGTSYAIFDTSDLDPDRYTIEYEDSSGSSQSMSFWVNEHEIDASFDPAAINQGQTDLTIDDVTSDVQRDELDVNVSAEYDNESLSADVLENIFGPTTLDVTADSDNNRVTIADVTPGNSIAATFDGQNTGEYNFTVDITDTTATANATVSVTDADSTAVFDSNNYVEEAGDVAEFTVDLVATEDAYVNITDSNSYYSATIAVEGAQDADSLTFKFNTYEAGHEATREELVTVLDGEGNEITSGITVTEYVQGTEIGTGDAEPIGENARLVAGDYELESFTSDPTGEDGASATDVSLLVLNERSTGDATSWVMPSDASLGEIDVPAITESATQRDTVAEGDYLVTQVEATGIYGYAFEDTNGDGVGDEWTGEGNLQFYLNNTQAPPYGEASTMMLSGLDSPYKTLPDAQNDTFYVVFGTNSGISDGADDDAIGTDETWNASFQVTTDSAYVAEDDGKEAATATFDYEAPSVELVGSFNDDDALLVPNSAESELTAETNIAPGTSGSFYLRFGAGVETEDATVNDDGDLVATLDLSGYEAEEEIETVRASVGNERIEDPGLVWDSGSATPASLSASADAPGSVATGDSASLDVTIENTGGQASDEFDYTVTVDGEQVDSGSTSLDSGATFENSYDFTTDSTGDIDWSVTVNGEEEASGTLSVSEDGSGSGDSDGGNASDSDDGDGDGAPGFGVAVALVALLAAAMLALRRQE